MMQMQEFFQSIAHEADARMVYGEPFTVQGKTILPVAKIRYGFGGGSGTREGEHQEQGFGGGGGFIGQPFGVVEVTAECTRFIPITDNRKVLIGLALGIWLGLLVSRRRVKVIRVDKPR